jgi:23S rRNA (uracil1939-C5)-methyltransferase
MPFFEKVTVSGIGAEGKAIARIDNMVCFLGLAAPGDVVDIQVKRKKKSYMEGNITRFHSLSPLRTEPFCKHFGVCGGCKWQHLPYSEQLTFKQKQVEDMLSRIGRVELPEIRNIHGSEDEIFYRNKLEYTFSPHRWLSKDEIAPGGEIQDTQALGFHIPGLFDKIVDIEKCWLQGDPGNAIRDYFRNYSRKNNLSHYSPRTHEGFLRNLILRTSTTGEVMVILVVSTDSSDVLKDMLDGLLNAMKESITSLYYVVNRKVNEMLYDQDMILYHGRDHITENMEDLTFRIGPKSFFQTNSKQALKLYSTAREFAGLKTDDVVYDLYTGTGTIALFIARQAGRVVGIESVPEAITDAQMNAALNKIENCSFYAGDMLEMLNSSFFAKEGRPDVIITDPPRAGMHEKVCAQLLNSGARTIVYVSCNPSTQARDLALLNPSYKVTAVQPVDMFPHTHHVENVVKLELRSLS